MRIGYVARYYPYQRNIVNLVPGVEYRLVPDAYAVLSALGSRLGRLLGREFVQISDWRNSFHEWGLEGVDLFHLFNAVSFGRAPWVTTFETALPRFRPTLSCHHGSEPDFSALRHACKVRQALEAMSTESCKHIIAMSGCTARIQDELLTAFPDLRAEIAKKLVVIHPPQPVLVSNFWDKGINLDGELTFAFVGAAFFSKGGREVIETLRNLRLQENYPIRLLIVSSLSTDAYATHTEPADVRRARQMIAENRAWIEYHPRLSNPSVLALMRRSHVGLLPTYADTYGYAALELMASGCPLISTNVRALSEVNGPDRGWVIAVPRNRLGEAIYTTPDQRLAVSTAIRKGIDCAVREVFADRSIIAQKAESGIAYIERSHSAANFARQMRAVYQTAASAPE